MRKSLILSAILTFALTACTAPQPAVSSPGVVIGDGPSTIVPKPVTSGPQVTTSTGVRVVFSPTSTVITNYSSTATTVCVNAECADLPAGYVATADTGAKAVTKLSVYGAELTFSDAGSYMRPITGASITTRRITTHHGTPIEVGDNIPGQGEAWTDRAGEITQLVIEHLE